MAQHRVRLMHRIAVDWVADTFGLRTPDARTRHENARFRAGARAVAWHDRVPSLTVTTPEGAGTPLPVNCPVTVTWVVMG